MKVLVTGGTGFVGKHLQEELAYRGVPFFAFGRRQFDLTHWEQAEAVFRKHQDADLILHLASFQAAGEFPGKHTAEQFFVNNLIRWVNSVSAMVMSIWETWTEFLFTWGTNNLNIGTVHN